MSHDSKTWSDATPFKEDFAKEKANLKVSDANSQYKWLIKPCIFYKETFNDCNSFYGQFNARYTTGHKEDCSQWYADYRNCSAYEQTGSEEALNQLIESEKIRRLERLVTMKNNNIWEYRESPPTDWNAPLPQHLQSAEDEEYLRSRMNKNSIFKCSVM